VNPSAAPRLLTLSDEKRARAAALGVERVEVVAFTPELARLGPEEFVRDVLRARFGVQHLVLGYDHGFGRGRSGDVEMVRRLAREDGFAMDVVPAVKDDAQPISSSLIRTAVAHGDLASAERGLGRPYSLQAVVERGAGGAGRSGCRRSTSRHRTRASCCRRTACMPCGSRSRARGTAA